MESVTEIKRLFVNTSFPQLCGRKKTEIFKNFDVTISDLWPNKNVS